MRTIVISHPSWLPGETEAVEALLDAQRNVWFHLRKPDANILDVRHFLLNLSSEARKKTVIHYHHSVICEFDLYGIHRSNANTDTYERYCEFSSNRSFAAHSFDDILANPGYTYYLLSPVFDSISKEGYTSRFSKYELTEFLHAYPELEVIALGGISDKNAKECRSMGFAGVAVLGYIWNAYEQGGIPLMMEHFNRMIQCTQ